MPKLSLYRSNKQNDFKFLDRTISEMFTVGATDLYIHKYKGVTDQGPSADATQPQYLTPDPTQIQDLLFLENRDRSYDPNIFRLRGHYNVQNLDFDLSQFGLFLNNDIIFITVHYNDMIEIIGRKLMVGDVLELPHLLDYNPLKETIPVALKRFYQITDANYASEGFSQTWYPHLWRIKCEPLVNSQEFSQILQTPTNTDTYLGQWDPTKSYTQGYVISYGDKNYTALTTVPPGTTPPNVTYWAVDESTLGSILSTYNKNIAINNAALEEAKRILPKSGYTNQNLYVVPTYGEWESNFNLSGKINEPAPPTNIVVNNNGAPQVALGSVAMIRSPNYRTPSAVIRIPMSTVKSIWDITVDTSETQVLDKFIQTNLQVYETSSQLNANGSGSLEGDMHLKLDPIGPVTGPYGTSDNTYASSDQDPDAAGFNGTEPYGPDTMNYRADSDPRFQYIARATPRSFGFSVGYMSGEGIAPNGLPTGSGISFPQNPNVGDYFLRIDYLPQLLFRWDGKLWVRISSNVRTETGLESANNKSQLSSFINNSNSTTLTSGTIVSQSQPLSSILRQPSDPLPPVV